MLQEKLAELKVLYDVTQQPIICSHTKCPECIKKEIEQQIELQKLRSQIDLIEELITQEGGA